MALVATGAKAEQRASYGSDGRVVGRSTTGTNGARTLYGADGWVVGREATGSNGTIVVYGADGRVGDKATGKSPRNAR
jgi:hypothetical protein